jgi:hypothetical protein
LRPVYFTVLISHVVLAVMIVPLVFIALTRALRERFDRHRTIALDVPSVALRFGYRRPRLPHALSLVRGLMRMNV